MHVRDLMTQKPIVAEVPGTRDEAVRLLVQHAVSGLPVVRERTRRLAGIVTRSDIFRNPEEEQLALIMTSRPITLRPEENTEKAARLFFERRIHSIPVVEAEEDLVGVLSPADVLRVIADKRDERSVETFIREKVCPVFQETPLLVVWEIMHVTHQNALPVLDGRGTLVGIVADSDLFKKSRVEDLVRKGALAIDEEDKDFNWDGVRSVMPLYFATSRVDLPSIPVKEIMTRDVYTVFQKTSASEAAKKLSKYHINQLPVINTEDRLVGMITDLDLMQAHFS